MANASSPNDGTDYMDGPYGKPAFVLAQEELDRVGKVKPLIYVAGSMRNRDGVLNMTAALEVNGFRVFNSWINPGPETDDQWMEFQKALGRDYFDAMEDPHVYNVFEFDLKWLDKSDALVVVGPAGKSAHAELGYMRGRDKPTVMYIETPPERWDIMARYADKIVGTRQAVLDFLKTEIG